MNKVWTESEIAYLKSNAGIMKDEEIAEDLTRITGRNVTKIAVRRKRQKLLLRKRRSGGGVCSLDLSVPVLLARVKRNGAGENGKPF